MVFLMGLPMRFKNILGAIVQQTTSTREVEVFGMVRIVDDVGNEFWWKVQYAGGGLVHANLGSHRVGL